MMVPPLSQNVSPHAYPLDEFYALAGRILPDIKAVEGSRIPEPHHSLLVHTNDMTPTLAGYYGEEIHLKVIHRQQRDDLYFREVVLVLDQSLKPIEFGAIKIYLNLFPPAARRHILEEKLPLGNILARHKIVHTSRPKAYLKMESDDYIGDALDLTDRPLLYGRRNTLFDAAQHPLAEIVEILPPVPSASARDGGTSTPDDLQ